MYKCEIDLLQKDEEIQSLKEDIHEISNIIETKKESTLVKNREYQGEIRKLKEENLIIRNEMNSVKNQLEMFTKQNIEMQKNNSMFCTQKDDMRGELNKYINKRNQKNISENEGKIKEMKQEFHQSMNDVYARLRNTENILFYGNFSNITSLEKTNYTWRLQNYQLYFQNGMPVRSPKFYTKPGGHRCFVVIEWSGENKEDIGLYFSLCRGKYDDIIDEQFSMNIEFEIEGKLGFKKKSTITPQDIDANRETCFTLHSGEHESRAWYGLSNMLAMPRDAIYITNNGLTLTCSFTQT